MRIRPDDFTYALENTRVLVRPSAAIETFGTTVFRFHLVTEPMDETGSSRLRRGMIHAERPRIITSAHLGRMMLEGFGERAGRFAAWLGDQEDFHMLRYGFSLRKTDFSENDHREPKEALLERLSRDLARDDDPIDALIEGIDDAWEVCLMKFTMDLVKSSSGENVSEWRRRGLI
jgi:hypothetical protein